MRLPSSLAVIALLLLARCCASGQATPGAVAIKAKPALAQGWTYYLTLDSYLAANSTSFLSPIASADRKWLHLEARYNYKNLRTASFWAGYNFSRGDAWALSITPMIGGVLGRTSGVAPACEASLTYKSRLTAYIENEYVFDTTSKAGDFYYAWPQVAYNLTRWLQVGAVAQNTIVYSTAPNLQGGFLVGLIRKRWELTSYVFQPGTANTTVVLESGVTF